MIEQDDLAIIDETLAQVPQLLLRAGIGLKQKSGYKAGKLSATRNWCRFIDGDIQARTCFPNNQGQVKTWKLFARFDASQSPSQHWDKLESHGGEKVQWSIAGDVWGIAYEDLREWMKSTGGQLLERIVDDLEASFKYSKQRYC